MKEQPETLDTIIIPPSEEMHEHESRMRQHLKKQTTRNILLVLGGIILLGVILIVFGTQLLIGFSLLLEKAKGNDTTTVAKQTTTYIAPPTLNTAVDATNSAQIEISGFAEKNQTISLFINDHLVDKTSVRSDKHFNFPDVTLEKGKNVIKAKAVTEDHQESSYSNEIHTSYLKNEPSLSIDKPQDGQGFNKNSGPVSIEGQTDLGIKITVNEFVAIVDDQGKFSYLYNIKDGDNDIKVVATDDAGNKKTQEIHIHTN